MKLRNLLLAIAVVACGSNAPAPQQPAKVAPHADQAKTTNNEPLLPLWSAVKRGVLPNGLTYYVLPHGKPEKRAQLWLAVNAGSVQEDDDQRGLAHFVEHMAFNGTKRFPKQDIVNYVESVGIKFGPHLNAFTSFDETVYQLQVPTDDPKVVSKGLEILRDWAGDITFDPAEVDKERGVVLEEWRLGRGVQGRMLDKLIEVVFGESRYAKRLPIGLPEILKKAPRDTLVRFYKDWYRPDRMAVIAVGDFSDTAAVEKEITATFGDLVNPAKPRQAPANLVPKASGTRIAIESDKELPVLAVGVGNLIPHRPEGTISDFRRSLTEQLYVMMLNERLQSIGRRPDAPFAMAQVMLQSITREVDGFIRFAIVKGDDSEPALRSLFAEAVRVEKHGFVQSELDRARTIMTRNYEQGAMTASTRDNRDLTEELVRNFLEKEFVVGAVREKDLAVEVLPKITVADVNSIAKNFGGPENRVIVVVGPDGKPQPNKQRVLAIVDEVGKASHEAWQDTAVATNLMKPPAWPGNVAKETKIEALGVTEWMLSNGVRVIVKPTDYEKDNVVIRAVSPGGVAVANVAEYPHARFADDVAALGGVGEFDVETLNKALAGKQVAVHASIQETTESISGNGSARDLETILQLVHLKMTAPRKDAEAFGVWKTNLIDSLVKQERSPEYEFDKKSGDVLWQNNIRRRSPVPSDVKLVDQDKALAFYRGRFANAADFTFVIVGAVDLEKLKPLVESYLGSLPAQKNVREKEKDVGARRVAGVVKKSWNLGIDQDKARVQLLFHGDEAWSRDKERDMFILGSIASIRLREVLREDMGGVYGVGAGGSITRSPRQERTFNVQFGCAPDAVDKLVAAVYTEIGAIAKNGIATSYLDKVKAGFLRDRETAMRTNNFWVDWLSRSARYGDDPKIILDTKPVLDRMTSDNVKAAAIRYLDGKRTYQAVMLPGKK